MILEDFSNLTDSVIFYEIFEWRVQKIQNQHFYNGAQWQN